MSFNVAVVFSSTLRLSPLNTNDVLILISSKTQGYYVFLHF